MASLLVGVAGFALIFIAHKDEDPSGLIDLGKSNVCQLRHKENWRNHHKNPFLFTDNWHCTLCYRPTGYDVTYSQCKCIT